MAVLDDLEQVVVRIPAQTGHRFRTKLDTDSGGNWTLIPDQSGQ